MLRGLLRWLWGPNEAPLQSVKKGFLGKGDS